MQTIRRRIWAKSADGSPIYKYTITNASGASVVLSNIGAAIVGISVPDRKGNLADVVLGFGKAESYLAKGNACAGMCPGRYANRIAKGRFSLDGKVYELPVNNGPNHLHGGPEGFGSKVWKGRKHKGAVEFRLVSEDGEMGYPGRMEVMARYEWSEDNRLTLTFTATTDAKTVINLTNHAYFNLDGVNSKTILRHTLRLNASRYLPTDSTLIPTGELQSVKGTPMDFRKAKTLGHDINKDFPALKYGKGYDACWAIDGCVGDELWQFGSNELKPAAELASKASGRVLKIFTTQPGIQVYTGNWLEGCPEGKRGRIYHDYSAVALECQHFPDSPNKPSFPSTVLEPGTRFKETIVFAFSTEK